MITKRPQDFSHGGVYDNWFHNLFYHPPLTARKVSWSRGGNLQSSIPPPPHREKILMVLWWKFKIIHPYPTTPPQEMSRGLMVKIQNHPSPTMRKISWSRGDNKLGTCVRSSNQFVDKKISVPTHHEKNLVVSS